jgi:carbamoyl-phosphate synthase large subunit
MRQTRTMLHDGELLSRLLGSIAHLSRRNAVDFGLPLLNNARNAQLWVDALAKKIPEGGLRKYTEGRIPSEVRSWSEFIGKRA